MRNEIYPCFAGTQTPILLECTASYKMELGTVLTHSHFNWLNWSSRQAASDSQNWGCLTVTLTIYWCHSVAASYCSTSCTDSPYSSHKISTIIDWCVSYNIQLLNDNTITSRTWIHRDIMLFKLNVSQLKYNIPALYPIEGFSIF